MASTNCSSNTHVCTKRVHNLNNTQRQKVNLASESTHHASVTFTIVLLCRMKVPKPNQRSFMHSSNATMTKASSSRVAWTCKGITNTLTPNCVYELVLVCVSVHVYVHSRRRPGAVRAPRELRTETASSAGGPSAAPSCRTGGCGRTGTPPAPSGYEDGWRTYHCSLPPGCEI